MKNKKVVGLFESRTSHVKLLYKNGSELMNTCPTCNQVEEKTTNTRSYKKDTFTINVTNIPCTKCRCDVHYSLSNLMTIEQWLNGKHVECDQFVSFNEIQKD